MTLFNSTPNDDNLSEFLADVDAKFKKEDGTTDVDALRRGKAEADRFIERLKSEAAGMREDLTKRATYEDLMAQIKASRDASSLSSTDDDEQIETPEIKSVDIEALVDKKVNEQLTLKQQQVFQDQNMQFVEQELTKTWGKNYVDNLRARARELDLSEKKVNELAATAPKALLEMLRPVVRTQDEYTPPSSTRSVANTMGKSDWDKFDKLRKENPALYWTPKVQNELHKLALQKKENLYK